ncbi:hypothetical protein O6H91_Y258600 [Diphasiastrum complanatum]|nr:hypothetical protein O6H91_Y258600 [Diphasiastrum complanatum]
MLTLLTFVVALEAVIALLLLSGLPTLYKLPRAGLDLLKTSRGVAISRTLFGTSVVMLASAITSIQKTQKRIRRFGAAATPADHYALSTLFLESSLLGKSLE